MLVLPPELLLELVLEHLDGGDLPGPDRDTIKSLTLTCSQLRPVTQPILFSTIRIGETAKRDDLRVSEIQSLFQSRPESAQWIRRLYISIYNSQATPGNMWGTDMEALAKNLETIFLNMTCLQEVHIGNTHITSAMHAHLWTLARGPLRELRLWEIEVDDILGGPPSAASELAIEVFGVDLPSWRLYAPITEMIHSSRLRRLQFSSTALPAVFGRCNIKGRTTPTAVFSELQYLELPSPYYNADTGEFLSFLACCPEVRTLIISPSVALPSSFSASISTAATSKLLPLLSEYEGPLELCRVLCPGRPLRAVKLPEDHRHPPLTQADMAALAAGSVSLQAFEFSARTLEERTFCDLADFFPALKGLSITFNIVPSYTLKLAGVNESSWDKVKSAAERRLLTQIHAAEPSLKFVHFLGENYWECSGGLWSLSNGYSAGFNVFPSSSL
ncbi:hypothetical protein FRC00_005372 [Tulasnella sp. 408]|nr:hypothetical protein FRC00_005372 [Tulasnella sp. 408]